MGGKKKEGSDTSTAVREGKGGEMTSASEPVQLKDFKWALQQLGTSKNAEQRRSCTGTQIARDEERMSESDKEREREDEWAEPKEIETIAIIKAEDEVTAGDMVRL